MDEDVRSVCASNLIFVRSRSEDSLNRPRELAEKCWPIHQRILEIVQPQCIVTFGGKVFDFISNKASRSTQLVKEPSGHGNWHCYFSQIQIGNAFFNLINLPHLSRYAINDAVAEWASQQAKLPISWLRDRQPLDTPTNS